jgi:hypothetical protein
MNNYALLQSCRWFRSSRISQEINKSQLAAHSQPMVMVCLCEIYAKDFLASICCNVIDSLVAAHSLM